MTFVAHQLALAVNLMAAQTLDVAIVRVVHVEHDFPVAVHEGSGLVGILDVAVAIAADFGFGGFGRLGDAVTVFTADRFRSAQMAEAGGVGQLGGLSGSTSQHQDQKNSCDVVHGRSIGFAARSMEKTNPSV